MVRLLRRITAYRRSHHSIESGRQCRFEALEERDLLSVAPEEQYFVYLLNRARHDPAAYQIEQNLPVDLSYVTPRPPLAVNDELFASAEVHANVMVDHNEYDHFSPFLNEWPNKMVRDQGYSLPSNFPDDTNYVESIDAGFGSAVTTLNILIVDDGVPDLAHRNHLLGIDTDPSNPFQSKNRDIGVGHAFGANAVYHDYWVIHATFSSTITNYATGVVFNDSNSNQRYDQDEGLSGITITAGGLTTTTNAAGGWSLPLADGQYLVKASGGLFSVPSAVTVTVSGNNVEADFAVGLATGYVNFKKWVSVNNPPAGTDKTVTTLQDSAYTFTTGDFGFSDTLNLPPDNLLAVKITTLPTTGSLADNGVAVSTGQFIAVSDINGGKLTFTPASKAHGSPYTRFTFQVQDDGGTAGGGVDLDQSPNTITMNVVAPGAISINDVRTVEGDSGLTSFVFQVTLSGPSPASVTVAYSTTDGTAVAGTDYQAISGSLTFGPGVTSLPLTVFAIGDTTPEPDETFLVNLSNPSSGSIAKSQGTGTIVNDELSLSIGDVTLIRPSSGTANAVFRVTVPFISSRGATVAFATADGTALAGRDYQATSGTLTFGPGSTSASLTVAVIGDSIPEPDETFLVHLSNPANAAIINGQGTGTIITAVNGRLGLSIGDVNLIEPNSGTAIAVFTVTAPTGIALTASVAFATVDGTALAGSDYVATRGVLTFSSGATSRTITVPIIGDLLNEPNEQFFVQLSDPSQCYIINGQGIGTIIDNDVAPAIYVGDVTIAAGNVVGQVNAVFPVALDRPSAQVVTVSFATADGQAKMPTAYTAETGTLTFAPGEITKLLTVPIMGETSYQANEQFFLNLSQAVHGQIIDGQGVCTIVFADPAANEMIIDDGDPGYTHTSGWTTVTNLMSYQSDIVYATAGDGSQAATWSFAGLVPGTYQVMAHWVGFSNWASNAPFTISDGSTTKVVTMNERLQSTGDVAFGMPWQALASFNVGSSGTLSVTLRNNANGYVVGDAIRIIHGSLPAPSPEIDVAGLGQSIADGDNTPAFDDGTDFGVTEITGTAINTNTFTITNTGNEALHLSGNPLVQILGANAADFRVISQPSTAVPPLNSTTSFQVMFVPSDTGLRTATIEIPNDDATENSYSFQIQGTGVSVLALHNAVEPTDVNADGIVSALDALIVINRLNSDNDSPGNSPVGTAAAPLASVAPDLSAAATSTTYYYDVNDDHVVSAIDALIIINQLNRLTSQIQLASISAPLAPTLAVVPSAVNTTATPSTPAAATGSLIDAPTFDTANAASSIQSLTMYSSRVTSATALASSESMNSATSIAQHAPTRLRGSMLAISRRIAQVSTIPDTIWSRGDFWQD